MKEPVFLYDPEKGQKVEINGLADFIKKAWLRENEIVANNEKFFESRINALDRSIKVLVKAHNGTDIKSSLAILGVMGLGFLAKKRFMTHTKQIEELKTEVESLKKDISGYDDRIDELEAELYEMNERLHAVTEKEDKKEG